jgi:hypothetical protein
MPDEIIVTNADEQEVKEILADALVEAEEAKGSELTPQEAAEVISETLDEFEDEDTQTEK